MKFLKIAALSLLSLTGFGQGNIMSIKQAIDVALKNNGSVRTAAFELEAQKQLKKTSFDLPKANVALMYGQYNSYKNDNNISITETIPFTALGSQHTLMRSMVASAELKKATTENELIYQVKQVYYHLTYTYARHRLLLKLDSIYEGFLKSASLRYKTGEANLLEKTTAEVQRNDLKNQLGQTESDIIAFRTQLKTLTNSEALPEISSDEFVEISYTEIPDSTASSANPSLAFARQQIEVAQNQKRVEAAKFAPDLLVGFFTQTLIGVENTENGNIATSGDRFTGFQVGLSIPLWFVPHKGRVKAAELNKQAAKSNYEYFQNSLQGQLQQASQLYTKNRSSLAYYRDSALPNADLIFKQSQAAFRGGEINYTEYLLGLRNAVTIQEGYLQTLNDYNQSIIQIEYLSGNK